MTSIVNRIKTITGIDAKPHQFVGRLLFYAWASNLPLKLVKKLLRTKSGTKQPIPVPKLPNSIRSAEIEKEFDQPLISIIIPTKNQSHLLKQCVDSIIQVSDYQNFEIIIVDNQSTEVRFFNLMENYMHQLDSRFRCVKADFDFNFSMLVNLGFKSTRGKHIVLLNNDTQVLSPRWLNDLLAYSALPEIGAVGCKLLYPNLTIQHAGIEVYTDGTVKHAHLEASRNAPEVTTIQSFAALTAAALMVKRSLFEITNGFDQAFKVEFNDIDFCLRLQEQGYVNIYLPQVELLHYESASRRHPLSNPKSYKRFQAEQNLMIQKHGQYLSKFA